MKDVEMCKSPSSTRNAVGLSLSDVFLSVGFWLAITLSALWLLRGLFPG